jgi:hypothetical protein
MQTILAGCGVQIMIIKERSFAGMQVIERKNTTER